MLVENLHTYGWVDAIRGMRNPLNSWEKGDSSFEFDPKTGSLIKANFGPNDRSLMESLVKGGSPHRKFLRQIFVTMDITAPTYWWAEMDTYKVSTTRDSCSVQHKGASRDFEPSDFTVDPIPDNPEKVPDLRTLSVDGAKDDLQVILGIVNKYRKLYVETKDYSYFRLMRQFLPTGYEYKATWSGNMEVLLNIYEWRKNHRLKEWHEFCSEIEKIIGFKEITGRI